MICAIYARVSTSDQSTESQISALREFVTRRGWEIGEEYIDVGVSGAKERRNGLDKLMKDARRAKFGAVAVFRFDRFARSVSHLARALDEFRILGIDFVSLHEALDTSTPMGRAMFHIAGAFAELEREIIRERVIAGLNAARKRGVRLGRKPLLVNHARVLELTAAGLSTRKVGAELGISDFTVRSILALHRGES